jgi:hypothetical protein
VNVSSQGIVNSSSKSLDSSRGGLEMETSKKFQIGQELSARSLCDYDCVFRFTVVKRTAKTVSVTYFNQIKTVKIRLNGEGEYCYPLGTHSMAVSVSA